MLRSKSRKLLLGLSVIFSFCSPLTIYAAPNSGGTEIKRIFDSTVNAYVGEYSVNAAVANGNVVIDSDGYKGHVMGGFTKIGEASGNTVTTQGAITAIVTGSVYGGYTQSGIASCNTVNINGGNIKSTVYGGWGFDGANDNTVNISGGSVKNITGGNAASDTTGGSANGNNIIITGGTIRDYSTIYGGISQKQNAINNTITIDKTVDTTPIFGTEVDIYGGVSYGGGDYRTGNTLNVYVSGIELGSVKYFQNYDIAIDKNQPTLVLNSSLEFKAGDKVSASRVLSDLNIGDSVTIMSSKKGFAGIQLAELQQNGEAKQGILHIYKYNLMASDSGEIIAKIIEKDGNKQSKTVVDGRMAALGMLMSGADLTASAALGNAASGSSQYDVFGEMSYGQYSMNNVVSVDIQGTSMLVGMSRNLQQTNSYTTIGTFIEAGWGTYDSEMSGAKAKGHTNYYGLGLLARKSYDSGVYMDGSLRIGRIGNTYTGQTAEDGMYDMTSTYYGLHLGIGKIAKINKNSSWDMYAKYFWTHQTDASTDIVGDRFEFSSIDSHRVRVGARYNSTNKNIMRYIGLAYEHEFSGTASVTAQGMNIASPSVKGSSGILELGVVYKPAADSRFSMDFAMNGYAGKRQGFSGNMKLNWSF